MFRCVSVYPYVCIEVNSFVTLGEQGGEGLFMSAWVGGRSCPLIGLGYQRASPYWSQDSSSVVFHRRADMEGCV